MEKRSLAAKLNKKGTKRILALDGGGIRGALTLGYLEKIESRLRTRYHDGSLVLADYYDLIGGTSTGAIIASCLAVGKPVSEIISLYQNFGKEVFGKRRYPIIPRSWTNFRAILKSSYRASVIESLLKDNLKDANGGEIMLGDQNSVKCGLTVVSKRADTYSLWTFPNHPDGIYYNSTKHLKLWELCRASSAAPYYFTPKKLRLLTRDSREIFPAFIDGGVSLANNPALQLFLTVTIPSFGFNWAPGENNILITSLGTGNGVKKENPVKILKMKAISWASKIPELFMTEALEMNQTILQLFGENIGPAEVIDSQYQDLATVNYSKEKLFSFVRLNVKLTKDYLNDSLGVTKNDKEIASLVEMDHYENIDELLMIGRKSAENLPDSYFPAAFNI